MMDFNPRLSRRKFLTGFGALVFSGALGGYLLEKRPAISTEVRKIFSQPREIVSENGLLHTRLNMVPKFLRFNSGHRWSMTYNGEVPGPTIRVKPGDILKVDLVNHIGLATNLHTHGLHVSPNGNSDNSFLTINSDESFNYEYRIMKDQRGGIFWYHPHVMPNVSMSEASGLHGVIIVEDEFDKQEVIKQTRERILVLATPLIESGSKLLQTPSINNARSMLGDIVTINNLERPVIDADTQLPERWRLLNAAQMQNLEIFVSDVEFLVIATDGGRLDKPFVVERLLMAPASRYEVILMPKSVGKKRIVINGKEHGEVDFTRITTFTISDAMWPELPIFKPTNSRKIVITKLTQAVADEIAGLENNDADGSSMSGMDNPSSNSYVYTFDGNIFNPLAVNQHVKAGSTEEWIIENRSDMEHPFHIHTWSFLVTDDGFGNSLPGLRDVVPVPIGRSVKFNIKFDDFTGKTMYHCHILDHEDDGMMGVVEVQ